MSYGVLIVGCSVRATSRLTDVAKGNILAPIGKV